MQSIVCDRYPVVGWLLNNALDTNKWIHRTTLLVSAKGRINVYYHMNTFILECDTDGDHNANEYYFFAAAERQAIHDMIGQMILRLDLVNQANIHEMVDLALQFISTDYKT